ncbi:hypothetical protein QMZ92_35085 [Streptomyces sp. HNM0645]|uniref:hypothetical protein n=1 Tax=Streptomyces sp. HNM0645 TaxID=2782343 RepID=UPI0024B7A045|nr:hypothetical protein [Streptomyces sp. HNM0645]MDI9889397.1 hypothetical protein [Streptomyces sp. HNM0645]
MTVPKELRLLPWSGPEGKPCYLSTDDQGGYMSRLPDNVESIQIGSAAQLLNLASELLDDKKAGLDDMRRLTRELVWSLRDVLRIATSRGDLLGVSEPHDA